MHLSLQLIHLLFTEVSSVNSFMLWSLISVAVDDLVKTDEPCSTSCKHTVEAYLDGAAHS